MADEVLERKEEGAAENTAASSQIRGFAREWGSELIVLVVIVVLGTLVGIGNPVFFSPQNLLNILQAIAVVGIAAIGATLVIVSGNLDLSVGSIVSLGGLMCAIPMLWGVLHRRRSQRDHRHLWPRQFVHRDARHVFCARRSRPLHYGPPSRQHAGLVGLAGAGRHRAAADQCPGADRLRRRQPVLPVPHCSRSAHHGNRR
jgi:ribose/xylose/arabinose/galactoside ABC-type transport system permease subunit